MIKVCRFAPRRMTIFNRLQPKYLIGMNVPPVMGAQIAHQIYLPWFETSISASSAQIL